MKNTFWATNQKGEKTEYEVLHVFDNPETNLSYVIYTDNTEDEEGNIRAYASAYLMDGDEMELIPIETDEEWAFVEKVLDETEEDEENNH